MDPRRMGTDSKFNRYCQGTFTHAGYRVVNSIDQSADRRLSFVALVIGGETPSPCRRGPGWNGVTPRHLYTIPLLEGEDKIL